MESEDNDFLVSFILHNNDPGKVVFIYYAERKRSSHHFCQLQQIWGLIQTFLVFLISFGVDPGLNLLRPRTDETILVWAWSLACTVWLTNGLTRMNGWGKKSCDEYWYPDQAARCIPHMEPREQLYLQV